MMDKLLGLRLMSRRRNKQNRVSVLINKKPGKCMYEKGVQVFTQQSEQSLVPTYVINKWNQLCDDVLSVIPNSESWNLVSKMLEEMGQRKESPEAGTSRDSSNF